MRKLFLLVLLGACTTGSFAQMLYSYDKSGNRIKSQLTITPVTAGKSASSETSKASDEAKAVCAVYPNPTHSNVHISITRAETANNTKATLYDVAGKAIKEVSFSESETAIDLTGLENAVYFLHVKTGSRMWQWKIVKQ